MTEKNLDDIYDNTNSKLNGALILLSSIAICNIVSLFSINRTQQANSDKIINLSNTRQVHRVSLYNENAGKITGENPTHVITFDQYGNAIDTVDMLSNLSF